MKLSVALITYNQEKFIAQAIESALAQKVNFDYEIVIGEDCSTDGTRALVTDFAKRYPGRIQPILRDHNVGANNNFKEVFDACRGQYLALLEGDDYWTCEHKLQKQVDFLDAHSGCALSCHRVRAVYETGSENIDFNAEVFPAQAAGTYTIENLLHGNFVMTCSTVLRRAFLGVPPSWLSEMKLGDWPLCALAAQHGTIELMDDIMAAYRVHPGSTWSSLPSANRLREVIRMLKALDQELGYRFANTIRETIARFSLELALSARGNGKRIDTAWHLANCIRNGGFGLGVSPRTFLGLAAYILIGSGYRVFSRAKSANGS